MNLSMIKPVLFGTALCCGCAFQANAIDVERLDFRSATSMCSGTTSVGGGNLRYRPLSIDNIGTTDQFVSCGFGGDPFERGSKNIAVRVYNGSTASVTVNCVLIDGYRFGPDTFATFTSKSVIVSAGQGGFFSWVPGDITPVPAEIGQPNVQCVLPGGVSLNYGYQYYDEDVGA